MVFWFIIKWDLCFKFIEIYLLIIHLTLFYFKFVNNKEEFRKRGWERESYKERDNASEIERVRYRETDRKREWDIERQVERDG